MTIAPPTETTDDLLDVAALIRAASADDHKAAESRGFVTRLMKGELSLDEYTRYLAQYAYIYEALESRTRTADDPEIFTAELDRFASIESDLVALGAADWRETHPALTATQAYADHLRSISDDDVLYLAHHYTRYLGDLSGGQAIAALVARHYGATPEQLSFYRFEGIAPVPFKRTYREGINGLALAPEQVDALIAEVRASFRFNSALFDALAA